jgi:WD40 repeat protein
LIWSFGWLGASQKAKLRSHAEMVTSVSYSRDGRRLAVGGLEKTVAIWEPDASTRHPTSILSGHSHHLRLVQFLIDGTLMSISQNGQVLIWDTGAAASVGEFHLSDRLATTMAAAPDGRRVATGGTDGKVILYDTVRLMSAATVGE